MPKSRNFTPDGTSEHPFVCKECNASQSAWDYLESGSLASRLIGMITQMFISLGPVAQKAMAQEMALFCPEMFEVAMREEREWRRDPPGATIARQAAKLIVLQRAAGDPVEGRSEAL
jgi:hypothetical protein